MSNEKLANKLEAEGIPHKVHEPLEKFILSNWRLSRNPGLTRRCSSTLILTKASQTRNLSWFLLGGGSNILIADGLFKGIMIHPNFPEEISVLEESKGSITVEVPVTPGLPG